jgi:hypothetical protein
MGADDHLLPLVDRQPLSQFIRSVQILLPMLVALMILTTLASHAELIILNWMA